MRTSGSVLEAAFASLPLGRMQDAALASIGRDRFEVELRRWYDVPERRLVAPVSALWESEASVYDVRGAVIPAVIQ